MAKGEPHIVSIMAAIIEAGEMRRADIAKRFRISNSAASRCVLFLKAEGLVFCRRCQYPNARHQAWVLAVDKAEAKKALKTLDDRYAKFYLLRRREYWADVADALIQLKTKAGDAPPPKTSASRSVFEMAA